MSPEHDHSQPSSPAGSNGDEAGTRHGGLSSSPTTPVRYAKRLEDYARDSVELGDSPRHSRESTRGLLRSHERLTDATSNGKSSDLRRIEEEEGQGTTGDHESRSPRSKRRSGASISARSNDDEDYEEEDESRQRTRGNGHLIKDGGDFEDEEDETHRARLGTNGRRRRSSIVQAAFIAKGFFHDNRGLLMIALAQLAFSLMNVMVKLMTANAEVAVPIWELILTRMGITWFFCYLTLRAKKVPDPLLGPKEVRGWLALRGVVGFFGLFGSYTSLQYLSLSDATVLGFLAPTVTAVLAGIFLREPYTFREATAGIVSLGGTILVAQPAFLFGSASHDEPGVTPEQRIMAVGVALLGVLGASAAYVTLRNIGSRAHALHGVQYFCMWCTIVSLAMPFVVPSQKFVLPYKPIFWVYLAAIGVAGFTAQYLLGRALQIERAGRAMLGNYTQLPWALLLQYIIFGETMDFLSCIGALIIMGSTIWVVLTKQKEKAAKGVVASDTDVERNAGLEHERTTTKLEAHLLPNAPVVTVPPTEAMGDHVNSSNGGHSLWFNQNESVDVKQTLLPK